MLQCKNRSILNVEIIILPTLCEGTADCEFACETIALKLLHYFVDKICIVEKWKYFDRSHNNPCCKPIEVETKNNSLPSSKYASF